MPSSAIKLIVFITAVMPTNNARVSQNAVKNMMQEEILTQEGDATQPMSHRSKECNDDCYCHWHNFKKGFVCNIGLYTSDPKDERMASCDQLCKSLRYHVG